MAQPCGWSRLSPWSVAMVGSTWTCFLAKAPRGLGPLEGVKAASPHTDPFPAGFYKGRGPWSTESHAKASPHAQILGHMMGARKVWSLLGSRQCVLPKVQHS